MGKILPVSLKLNFTPITLGCYGLIIRRELKPSMLNSDGTELGDSAKLILSIRSIPSLFALLRSVYVAEGSQAESVAPGGIHVAIHGYVRT